MKMTCEQIFWLDFLVVLLQIKYINNVTYM